MIRPSPHPLGGPASRLFELFGNSPQFLGGSPTEAFFWVIVVQIWANLGITMIIFLVGPANHPL
ncbi:MAG: hypothetical protein KIS63_02705 [Caldilineales bacterium]|nr:hypothetical protein [Caldilineales bacterium]